MITEKEMCTSTIIKVWVISARAFDSLGLSTLKPSVSLINGNGHTSEIPQPDGNSHPEGRQASRCFSNYSRALKRFADFTLMDV